MIVLFIIFVISLLLGVLFLWLADNDDFPLINLCAIFLFVFAGITLVSITEYNTPQAIDVYRGKTTLQITYQDSVPVDTVVVFKNEFNK